MDRHAKAQWNGSLTEGSGTLETQSGALAGLAYDFKARFKDQTGKAGTNPEELLAAAHAGCFAMQLSHMLAENGTPADSLEAKAVVTVQEAAGGGFEIPKSAIALIGRVPDIDENTFKQIANQAKESCPVSKALGAIEVTLEAKLA